MSFFPGDARHLWGNIRHEEKVLNLKKSWLLGSPTNFSLSPLLNLSKTSFFFKNEYLPESFVRDDDLSGECVRQSIERGFGVLTGRQGHHMVKQHIDYPESSVVGVGSIEIVRSIALIVDKLSNSGLFCLICVLTQNSFQLEKTRPIMKRVIKQYLQKLLMEVNQVSCNKLMLQLLEDLHSFYIRCVSVRGALSKSHIDAAYEMLGKLDGLSTRTLVAMYRQLRGIRFIPRIGNRIGWSRKRLIGILRKLCGSMFSQLHEEQPWPEPLAKAMAIAALSFKHIKGINDFILTTDFFHYPLEIETLRNQILQAMQTLPKIRSIQLRRLQFILDPEFKVPRKKFRSAVRNLLTEYFFECGNVSFSRSFAKALSSITNMSSCTPFSCHLTNQMKQEVECVLNVSAQLRQVVRDMLLGHTCDEEFADAYLDDFEIDACEDEKFWSSINYCDLLGDEARWNNSTSLNANISYSDSEVESVGVSVPRVPSLLENTGHFDRMPDEFKKIKRLGSCDNYDDDILSYEQSVEKLLGGSLDERKENDNNQYLAIQGICDEVSLIAHQLVGSLLEGFSNSGGVDVGRCERLYLNDTSVQSDH